MTPLSTSRSTPSILTLNAGSSSIRFALFRGDAPPARELHGKIDRIGQSGARLAWERMSSNRAENVPESLPLPEPARKSAASFLVDWLEERSAFTSVEAVGHRVVHGMQHTAPEPITPNLMEELRRAIPFAPEHLPREIELIEAIQLLHPRLPQLACFDTAFHHTLPRIARILPIPRRFESKGMRRYGFHGLSYAFLMEELARVGDPAAACGRVILAHLGNGASLAAVRDGKCIDTSMGLTPAAGIPMSTRTGDLDPGLFSHLARLESMSPSQFDRMVNHESGLLGISETSSDMRDLLECESRDVRAAEAVALFCYQTKKWIGSFAAALGGVDTLVFAGGIGENVPLVRERICQGLAFLGIELDDERNAKSAGVIGSDASRVRVRVIRTDEEQMIVRSLLRARATPRSESEETTCETT